jgi:hypothetical protein
MTKAKAIDQVVTSFGLHSGLRQGGSAFGVSFVRRAEALRFRLECVGFGLELEEQSPRQKLAEDYV